MKTPILLNILHHKYDTKDSHNFNNTTSRDDAGFTILELLVIVIMLGILASIAAPGWLGFINRQRVRTVNDRVFQSLRTAQSEAKRTKRPVTIVFNNNTSTPPVDPPTVTIDGNIQQLNAQGEIKPGTIALTVNTPAAPTTPPNSLTFDYQGNLTVGTTPFYVTVAVSGGGTRQCAIVQTIIGGMRTDEGTFNTTTNQGCR
ncbi:MULTISPECIES: prepilin-type N-terminal cleavage/methylation domain-containing protein [unclassified Microcoleus]|uniref:GspH/FimT family pseudopilin n=1 Tax=unclassified Microcoleus TaxID=2642155 RepID=UPI001DE1BD31|nr:MULTISPECIES: prepilin-type N-terminal cleavage/methylation domain-containing protein [unclassified Microcoleus]MCC3453465.1 prepilin-type N-terminal cleavage/methylation domain-containing protein [Microcoleus sp. PH2017_08_TRC_O_A]MCC3566462.1 prepilin-type N-terminal cleavage/methylation domain-containing protein [Microcoleus sp. PH2017_31_RDM_U_A]MCC3578865.1 prepilin-type N-terminal cleavage/methylation domain-containing protein [Microcoleus sp. PH2017_32_RDM_D_A]MCC3616906.1 prepilin-ty